MLVPTTAVLFVPTHPDRYLVAVRSLLDRCELPIQVGVLYPSFGPQFEDLGPRVVWRPMGSVSELVNRVHAETKGHVVVVDDALQLPTDPFSTAQRWVDEELRIATVSFLCNAADFLSFPVRNLPTDRPPEGHDEVSITRRLRALAPLAEPAPIAHAAGAVVLISANALGAVGELQAPVSARFDIAVADFSARARAKGFLDVVDTSTFYTRPSDVAVHPTGHQITPDDRGWLLHRHQSMVGYLDHERYSGDSPMAMAHQVARVKVNGMHVLVDGSCFGPHETGTQVATMHAIQALAARDDVSRVDVALPGAVPAYAAPVLTDGKVHASAPPGGNLGFFGTPDIAYRPYQPVPGWDVGAWRHAGVRLVVSMLDTIAFHNGGYFRTTGEWMEYRRAIGDALRAADAVTVISEDVAAQMRLHRLPIDSERLAVAPLGTEHLTGGEPGAVPAELLARGYTASEFALCLGVNYSHKNRELALLAHRELRRRGVDLHLVFAGPAVPHGTSRAVEQRLGVADATTFVLPEVTPAERNWLLRHASLLWYPTSAEGFGVPPYEAARFGTPAVMVRFGPLAELAGARPGAGRQHGPDVPVFADDWTPSALADAAECLVRDPDRARRHIDAMLAAGATWTWSQHAELLVGLFRRVLHSPRR